MTEWWTYSLSDFLMFSAPTWHRLIASYNASIWPLQLAWLAAGAACLALVRCEGRGPRRAAAGVSAAMWAWSGWAFLWRERATIDLAGPYDAAAFAVQALLLAAWAIGMRDATPARSHGGAPDGAGDAARACAAASHGAGDAARASAAASHGAGDTARARAAASHRIAVGALLGAWALAGQPLMAVALQRSWRAAEVPGAMPDPTATLTLAMLLLAGGAPHVL